MTWRVQAHGWGRGWVGVSGTVWALGCSPGPAGRLAGVTRSAPAHDPAVGGDFGGVICSFTPPPGTACAGQGRRTRWGCAGTRRWQPRQQTAVKYIVIIDRCIFSDLGGDEERSPGSQPVTLAGTPLLGESTASSRILCKQPTLV